MLALATVALGVGCDSARPLPATASQTTAERCGTCHGFPPPPGVVTSASGHPRSVACSLCHSTTVDGNYQLVPGGTHMNGRIDVTTHPIPYIAQHTAIALQDLDACKTCHGSDFSGGQSGVSCTQCHQDRLGFADWQTNCSFCHGTRTPNWSDQSPLALAAPPRGAHGETSTSQPPVGAHQKHVGNGSAISDGVDCTACHAVPTDLAHVTGGPATLTFGPLATQGGALAPSYASGSCAATYCHGASLQGGANVAPSWTGAVACGDCHGSPPATGRHLITPDHVGKECSACHATVASSTVVPGILNTADAKARHVDGTKDVSILVGGDWDPVNKTCSNVACHTLPPSLRHW
ncbi:MAG TPA: CxxxxCH/CxxCH domain-containing protein [Anaeromyxobacter sp.]|nr:CxxxxCH/CxxCH domain-containing protein [Anaeromyxobacter sp.]